MFLPSTLHTNFDILGTVENHIDRSKETEKECEKYIAQLGGKFMAQYSVVNTLKYLKIEGFMLEQNIISIIVRKVAFTTRCNDVYD
jgi:hypothetical protein